MSKSQILKHLVQERLTVAAEEVFALFENAIAEYEEELCRFKDQEPQHDFSTLRIQSVQGGDAQHPFSLSPVHQGIFWATHIKEEPEEHSISRVEEEMLQTHVPQLIPAFVKSEESPALQQMQVEDRGDEAREEVREEPEARSECSSVTDNDDDWGPTLAVNADSEERHSDGQSRDKRQKRDRTSTARNSFLPCKSESATKKSESVCKKEESETGKAAEKEKHQCNICKKTFEKAKGLKIHVKVIHYQDRSKVPENGVEPPKIKPAMKKSDAVLKEDKSGTEREAEKKKHQCNICKKTFDKVRGLTAHLKLHSGNRPYGCPFCEKCFKRKDSRDSHIRTHTGEKPYCCSTCKRCFADLSNLRKHEKSHEAHTDSEPLKCNYCTRTYTRKDNLIVHVYRDHKDEINSNSSKTSANKASLKLRKRSKTGESSVNTCQICKKEFAERSDLLEHEITHAAPKIFTCSSCPKTFSYKSHLDSHTRTHTGEKPYACPFCDRRFTHQPTLHVHKRLHTGEKPYQCLVCKKTFAQRSNLLCHKRKHTGEQPYKCPFCDKTFSQTGNRDSHIRTHHSANNE